MTRKWCGSAAVAVLVGLVGTLNPSWGEEKKEPSIKEIMTKAHKGANSLLGKLEEELKAGTPEWEVIQKQTKELVELGTFLGKNKPPKGEMASWEKLTKAYLDNAKDMAAAAQKKDKATTADDLKKVRGMCMNCHKEHKGG